MNTLEKLKFHPFHTALNDKDQILQKWKKNYTHTKILQTLTYKLTFWNYLGTLLVIFSYETKPCLPT